MSKKGNVWEDFLKPVVVLVCIALAAGVLLGFVNSKTEPIIEENARIKAEQTRSAVLSGAKGFEEIKCDTAALDIDSAYKETSGLGYVITSSHKGYGGPVVVTVGISPEGKIIRLSVDVSTETTGIGSKAGREDYVNRFMGLSGDVSSVDSISGASYSSNAVKAGVSAALAAYEALH